MNRVRSQRHASSLPLAAVLALVLGGVSVLAGCGDKGKDKPASQAAARVNRQEITVHQINFALQQQRGLRPEATEAASRQVLERLIDQELAIQKADELKLDRDPDVMQQVEATRREIIARAYMERAGDSVPKPTPAEVQKFFDDKPALFKDRKVFNLQELVIESKAEQFQFLQDRLAAAKDVNEFIEFLKVGDFKFTGNQAVRAAEQLPLASLDRVAQMRDGQAAITATPSGVTVLMLVSSRSQPVTLDQARPSIEQFLLNERKREMVAKEVQALRAAAKIEYIGRFDPPAQPPAGAASIAASASAAASGAVAGKSSNGLDTSSVSKGLGLK